MSLRAAWQTKESLRRGPRFNGRPERLTGLFRYVAAPTLQTSICVYARKIYHCRTFDLKGGWAYYRGIVEYHIAGKFGGCYIWRIGQKRILAKIKFGDLSRTE